MLKLMLFLNGTFVSTEQTNGKGTRTMFHPAIERKHLYNYACSVVSRCSATLGENRKFFSYFCWFPR